MAIIEKGTIEEQLYQARENLLTEQELRKKVNDCREIQSKSGNWDYNEYMRGMYNGLELACAILYGREPRYKEPKK